MPRQSLGEPCSWFLKAIKAIQRKPAHAHWFLHCILNGLPVLHWLNAWAQFRKIQWILPHSPLWAMAYTRKQSPEEVLPSFNMKCKCCVSGVPVKCMPEYLVSWVHCSVSFALQSLLNSSAEEQKLWPHSPFVFPYKERVGSPDQSYSSQFCLAGARGVKIPPWLPTPAWGDWNKIYKVLLILLYNLNIPFK